VGTSLTKRCCRTWRSRGSGTPTLDPTGSSAGNHILEGNERLSEGLIRSFMATGDCDHPEVVSGLSRSVARIPWLTPGVITPSRKGGDSYRARIARTSYLYFLSVRLPLD